MSQLQVPIFGQEAVKYAIRACGGKATKAQAIEKLREMGASASLQKTFGRAINNMVDKCEVTRLHEGKQWIYKLAD